MHSVASHSAQLCQPQCTVGLTENAACEQGLEELGKGCWNFGVRGVRKAAALNIDAIEREDLAIRDSEPLLHGPCHASVIPEGRRAPARCSAAGSPSHPPSVCICRAKMFLERVAESVSSLSKLKSVLVTDSHAQLLQRPCSATYGHEQRRRRLPSSSGDALPEG